MNQNRLHLSLLVVIPLSIAAGASAGDLNPPAGPVLPTGKTLTEVEPRIAVNASNTPGDAGSLYRIDLPGSYYLTGNIVGVNGKNGIHIATSNVTLDLMGFEVRGAAAQASLDGIRSGAISLLNVTIRNGTVAEWGGDGIDIVSTSVDIHLEDVEASRNGGDGLKVGRNSVVTHCAVFDNPGNGIVTDAGCSVIGCTARGNDGSGIQAGSGNTVTECSSTSNGDGGITVEDGSTLANSSTSSNTGNGVSAGAGCAVTDCTAFLNSAHGLSIGDGGSVTMCSARNNTLDGISAGDGCAATDCAALLNSGYGIFIGDGGTVTNCSARGNTANGISAGASGTITNCSAHLNTANGIFTNSGGTVSNCSAYQNTGDGIACLNECVIRGNTCSFNGSGAGDGAGVHAFGIKNRIESNHCTGADRGIDVDVADNIIIKNTCSGNTTNWNIVMGNALAPIVVATPNNANVVGNTYAGSLGSTDPNANFTY